MLGMWAKAILVLKFGYITISMKASQKRRKQKEFVHNSISGGFNFEKDPARLDNAIVNAKKNFSVDEKGTLSTLATELYRLGIEIEGFVKTDIAKLRNKLG